MLSKFLHKHHDKKDKEKQQEPSYSNNAKVKFSPFPIPAATDIHQLSVPAGITVTTPDGGPAKDILERQNTLTGRSLSTRQRIRRSIFGHHEREHENLPVDVEGNPDKEAEWEEKATQLAKTLSSNGRGVQAQGTKPTSDLNLDEQIQRAIDLHQANSE